MEKRDNTYLAIFVIAAFWLAAVIGIIHFTSF
jgi:hypothetical protein